MHSVAGTVPPSCRSDTVHEHMSSEIYDRAFSTGLLRKEAEEIVPVVLARASLIKRALGNDEGVLCLGRTNIF